MRIQRNTTEQLHIKRFEGKQNRMEYRQYDGIIDGGKKKYFQSEKKIQKKNNKNLKTKEQHF